MFNAFIVVTTVLVVTAVAISVAEVVSRVVMKLEDKFKESKHG